MKLDLKKIISVFLIVFTAVDLIRRKKWWSDKLSEVTEKGWVKEKLSGLKYAFHMN